MEGQRRRRQGQRLGDGAGMQALRSLLDQQAEDAQARLLRQRGQRDGLGDIILMIPLLSNVRLFSPIAE
jgi:hypothetical protein